MVFGARVEKGPREIEAIRRLCRRGTGVGADGVLFVFAEREGDPSSRIVADYLNADGSVGRFCGNGTRCAARFAVLRGLAGPSLVVATGWGSVGATVRADGTVALTLPEPVAVGRMVPSLDEAGRTLERDAFALVVGVPHVVAYVKADVDLDALDLSVLGPLHRRHPAVREGANANFVKVLSGSRIAVRTWERGVEAETLACGSGAVASAAVTSFLTRLLSRRSRSRRARARRSRWPSSGTGRWPATSRSRATRASSSRARWKRRPRPGPCFERPRPVRPAPLAPGGVLRGARTYTLVVPKGRFPPVSSKESPMSLSRTRSRRPSLSPRALTLAFAPALLAQAPAPARQGGRRGLRAEARRPRGQEGRRNGPERRGHQARLRPEEHGQGRPPRHRRQALLRLHRAGVRQGDQAGRRGEGDPHGRHEELLRARSRRPLFS